MTMTTDQQQKALVRQQFTRTAEVFGDYAVASRIGEAERLARMVGARLSDRVVDLACGPGTLALRFARQVRWVYGLDLTEAILWRARNSARGEALNNIGFALGDAHCLPFADRALDIAVTSYSLHHMPDPVRVVAEMARVLKRGGRAGVIDIIVPADAKVAERNNRIERLRDRSHTRTLARNELEAIFAANGLRVIATHVEEQTRWFDHWMLVAGAKPGDRAYADARSLLEASIADDAAGFHPQLVTTGAGGDQPEIIFSNTMLFIAAERL
jgi:ubiquinone/menaquinone biosynthesis C-methylase UbiE